MSLKQRISEELKAAMKARDEVKLSALRLLKSAVTNREIELGHDLDDLEVLKLVDKQIKQRRESAQIYREGGRPELAEREDKEAAALQPYLPARLSADELQKLVDEAIAETGASSMKQMGAAVKAAMARAQGRAEGKDVSDLIKRKLSQA